MIQPMNRPSPPTPSVAQAPDTALDEGRYLAVLARDARFDGHFFTAVTSTGIYCRPVCAVRTPRRENCRFFVLAAQAENAGFRPCLRCRPELAPQALVWSVQDASSILVQQAVRLLDAPDLWPAPSAPGEGSATVARLAERLGVSDRHLRRIFEAALGVSPLQYLQTRRLLTAKQLLTDTQMPITQVALASGFGSVRRFNETFHDLFDRPPSALRRKMGADTSARDGVTLRKVPVSLGKPTWETASGVKTILERYEMKRMVNPGPREPYDVDVPYALRLTPSGEYLHAAPWNLYNLGVASTSHGCTNMSMLSRPTGNRCQASISSSPLLNMVALSTLILAPIDQFGCLTACAGVALAS